MLSSPQGVSKQAHRRRRAFDTLLRRQDQDWGVRDLDEVARRDAAGFPEQPIDGQRDMVAELTDLYRAGEDINR